MGGRGWHGNDAAPSADKDAAATRASAIRVPDKEKAVPEGTAKFREETSKKADSTVSDRVAAMHNLAVRSFVGKRYFAMQHSKSKWTEKLPTSSKPATCRV